VSLSSLNLVWRSKDYYATGAAEDNLLAASDLAALQQLAASDDFAAKLAPGN
jgi:hypothetical protein